MKNFIMIPWLAAILLCAGSASASVGGGWGCDSVSADCAVGVIASYMDVKSKDVSISRGSSEDWKFDLDTDTLAFGQVRKEDVIASAKLDVSIWGLGIAEITIQEIPLFGDDVFVNETERVLIFKHERYDVLAALLDNHQMQLTIENKYSLCNLLVTNVTLSGQYCDVPAPVPLPSAILLFGSGLVGLVGARTRKKSH